MQPKKLFLKLIVAMTPERVIGRDNALPWRLPRDLERFKKITTDVGLLIVGRRTHESIVLRNGGPLVGRHTIVITHHRLPYKGSVETASSVEEALAIVARRGGRACVGGGAEIYKLFLPHAQMIDITYVYAPIRGDVLFPNIRESNWIILDSSDKRQLVGDEYPTSWTKLGRVNP